MKTIAVLSVDHTQARFFILKPAERPREQWSPILSAEGKLINAHWYDQKNETLTGGGQRFSYHVGLAGMGQTMHGYDDHLDRHQKEILRRFSKEVKERLDSFLFEHHPEELVIAAERKVLGHLRDELTGILKQKISLHEIATNFSQFSAVEIHEHLAKLGLLPSRSSPTDSQKEPYARAGQWRRRSTPSLGQEMDTAHESESSI